MSGEPVRLAMPGRGEWGGPTTKYEITVLGDDDVLDEVAAALRVWSVLRERRFLVWRAIPESTPTAESTTGPGAGGTEG